MSEKRYLVFPGWVRSRRDGDRHYVTAAELMRLYGVSPAECVVVLPGRRDIGRNLEGNVRSMVELHPRYDGDYSLPPALPPGGHPMTPSTRWAYVAIAALTVGCSSPTSIEDLGACVVYEVESELTAEEWVTRNLTADIADELVGEDDCVVLVVRNPVTGAEDRRWIKGGSVG